MSNLVDIGGIRAKIELDTSGYNAGIEKAKAQVQQLGAQSKKSADNIKQVGESLTEVGSSGEKLSKLTSKLDNVNAMIELQKKKLLALKESYDSTFNEARKSKLEVQIVRTEASLMRLADTSDKTAKEIWKIEDESAKAADQLREMGNESDKASNKFGALESALTAIGGTLAIKTLIGDLKEFVAESERMYNATKGLVEVAKNLGYSVSGTLGAVNETTKQGFMSVTESSQAYKTALAMGLTIEQTTELINAMADAAAYNRQAHYSWGESIVVAMEGIKNGNSTLTDSVGVTKNLSVMQEEYARTIGTTTGKLTDAQKVQAAYNGFLKESQIFAGNAAVALGDYTGTVAQFDQSMQSLKAGIGDGVKPLFAELTERITPIIQGLATWVIENKELVSGLVASTTALTGFVALVAIAVAAMNTWKLASGALKASLLALNMSLGPLGIAIGVFSLLAGAIGAYVSNARDAEKAAKDFTEAHRKLNAQLNAEPVSRSVNEYKSLKSTYDEMTGVVERLTKAEQDLRDFQSKPHNVRDPEAQKQYWEMYNAVEKLNEELNKLGVGNIDEARAALLRMKDSLDKSSVALFEMNKQEYEAIAAKRTHQEANEKLLSRYKELNAETKISEEQNTELKETINALKKEYPDLTWEIDEQGRARIANIDIIGDQITAERNLLDESTEKARGQVRNHIEVTKANKVSIEAQINNYQRLLEVMGAVAGVSTKGPVKPKIDGKFGFTDPLTESGATKYLDDNKSALTERFTKEQAQAEAQLQQINEAEKKMQQSLQNLSSGEFIDTSGGGGKSSSSSGKSPGSSGKSAAELMASKMKSRCKKCDALYFDYLMEEFRNDINCHVVQQ